MASVHIKMRGNTCTSIVEISAAFKEDLFAELVSESFRNYKDVNINLLSFEKYYFRNGSYAGLTVMFTETVDTQTADITGFGGGEGLFNLSWGANTHFAEEAVRILKRYGFSIEE